MLPFDKSPEKSSEALYLFDERSKSQEHNDRFCINEKFQNLKENEENDS